MVSILRRSGTASDVGQPVSVLASEWAALARSSAAVAAAECGSNSAAAQTVLAQIAVESADHLAS